MPLILTPSSPAVATGTVQELMDEARVLLRDPTKVRYPDERLLAYANVAFLTAYRLRPDLFFAELGSAWTDKAYADAVPISPLYRSGCINYIVQRAELKGAPYDEKGRQIDLLADFKQQLLTA